MKKYQNPNVKEVRLESSLFIMAGVSGGDPVFHEGNDPLGAPKRSL